MATYETLDVQADAGATLNVASRGKEVTYSDGYSQEVFIGLKKTTESIEFSRTGEANSTYPLYDKLRGFLENNTPFYWSYATGNMSRLYKIQRNSIKYVHVKGITYTVSATFEEWTGLGIQN